jgi:hypothetical protein
MRMPFIFMTMFILSGFFAEAHADTQPFCERVAKDFANASSSDVDKWLTDYRKSFSDCTVQYNADAKGGVQIKEAAQKVAKKIPAKVVIAPANASDIVTNKRSTLLLPPGSIGWNNYCAAKYASFNKLTGFYKSKNGKEHRCSDALN